jgi:hypothetical protein
MRRPPSHYERPKVHPDSSGSRLTLNSRLTAPQGSWPLRRVSGGSSMNWPAAGSVDRQLS